MPPTKWEYQFEKTDSLFRAPEMQVRRRGLEGWEVVGMGTYRRPISDERAAELLTELVVEEKAEERTTVERDIKIARQRLGNVESFHASEVLSLHTAQAQLKKARGKGNIAGATSMVTYCREKVEQRAGDIKRVQDEIAALEAKLAALEAPSTTPLSDGSKATTT